jgi:DNA-binding NarL/FixJ family response regulator
MLMIRIIVVMKRKEDLGCIMDAIDPHADLAVIGTETDYYRAIKLAETEQPDIVVVDYQIEHDGLDIIPLLKRKSPGTAVILFSPYDDEYCIQAALSRGVSAYLRWETDIDVLAKVVYMVQGGSCIISFQLMISVFRSPPIFHNHEKIRQKKPPVYKLAPRRSSNFYSLTQKEARIIRYIDEGKNTKEISEILHLKIGTVRNYISMMMQKTGASSRTQMARHVLNSGYRQSRTDMPSPIPFLLPSPGMRRKSSG